jgi:large subunit ribosomal protein L29
MKANELKEKSLDELKELLQQTRSTLFKARIANNTNQLDNTSSIPKARKDVARILGEIRTRKSAELSSQTTQGSQQ